MNNIIKNMKIIEGTKSNSINKEALKKGYIIFGDVDLSNLPIKNNKLITLFEEDDTTFDKVAKTLLEYDTSYGLNFFNTQIREITELDYAFEEIEVLTKKEFSNILLETIYEANALDLSLVTEIVSYIVSNEVLFQLDLVKNNDAFAQLITKFDLKDLSLSSGDAVLRVLFAKKDLSFIKSIGNLMNLSMMNSEEELKDITIFFENHTVELSTVFNRQKKIFMALKGLDSDLNKVINKISKMSKKNHKAFVAPAINTLNQDIDDNKEIDFSKFSFAELVKAYNANENKKLDFSFYNIRNGKVFYKESDGNTSSELVREVLKEEIIKKVKHANDLAIEYSLKTEEEKAKEDYSNELNLIVSNDLEVAIPTSGKTIFSGITEGTKMSVNQNDKLGIYWRNSWGARDLDLSLISEDGVKLGWNKPSETFANNRFAFSGDITNAENGANETFTINSIDDNQARVLSVNIYSRYVKEEDIVKTRVIRKNNGELFETQEIILPSKETTLGIIYNDSFIFNIKGCSNNAVSVQSTMTLLKNKYYLKFDEVIAWFKDTYEDELLITVERDITSLNLSDYSL